MRRATEQDAFAAGGGGGGIGGGGGVGAKGQLLADVTEGFTAAGPVRHPELKLKIPA